MRITFVTRKFGNVERNSHCDVLHFTPVRVAKLFLDCNGVFAIKAYWVICINVGAPRQRYKLRAQKENLTSYKKRDISII